MVNYFIQECDCGLTEDCLAEKSCCVQPGGGPKNQKECTYNSVRQIMKQCNAQIGYDWMHNISENREDIGGKIERTLRKLKESGVTRKNPLNSGDLLVGNLKRNPW